MKPRWRFIIILLAAIILAGWCGSRLNADDHAKPRSQNGGNHGQSGHSRSQPSHAQPRQHEGSHGSSDGQRGHAQARPPQNNEHRNDAERRQPGSGYRNDRSRDNRGDHRYDWRNYSQRNRWDRDRFPRQYPGQRSFGNRFYRGHGFGPHYRLWYRGRSGWSLFYWPFMYAPVYGCGWYWVPTDRAPVYDPQTGEDSWEYTDYQYVYLCFD